MVEIETIKESFDLSDIWRDLHPEIKRFTWRRRNPEIHCRLDFFLVSTSLSTYVLGADIPPGFRTDHSLITLCIDTKTNPRGPGYWKLNTHLLTDLDYINHIKTTINEVSKEYERDDTVDAILLWDVIKMRIRASSINYAKEYRAKQRRTEISLEEDISTIEQKLEGNDLSDDERAEILTELALKKNVSSC